MAAVQPIVRSRQTASAAAGGPLWLLATKYRALTLEMAKREVTDRYSGQLFGALWLVLHPVALVFVYVFVFGYVLRVRIAGPALPYDYTTYLLAGVIPWIGFQDALTKSSTVIVSNASLVKQVIFPIEILPVKGVLSSLATQAVLMILLAVYVVVRYRALPWTYALAPVLIVLQAAMMIGVSSMVASIAVFFRDTKDFVQVFSTVGLYLMPALYLPESVPQLFRPLLYLNPLSYLVWCYQDAFYFGRFAHPAAWLVLAALSAISLHQGSRVFQRLKTLFGNVL